MTTPPVGLTALEKQLHLRFLTLATPHHLPGVLVAVVLLTTALVIVVALLAAAPAGKLARMEGATYPTAFTRAAAFTAVFTLAATVTAALAALFA
ncbi:hypothetical protein [Streptomyces cahuitamycinicus]|uniref:hypothetical protein n=1 Tax=Streptomyces cahuitamycinicus TaxID=2070367 RepID=UPI001FE333D0|nr:hypothetical protein [Streptomyces cahuitamycinicus]